MWHLHGLALVGCERVEEATGSFAKALRLHALEADEPGTAARGEHARRRVAHLTALFLDGARRAPAAAPPCPRPYLALQHAKQRTADGWRGRVRSGQRI